MDDQRIIPCDQILYAHNDVFARRCLEIVSIDVVAITFNIVNFFYIEKTKNKNQNLEKTWINDKSNWSLRNLTINLPDF
jgi:hypothetical protein